MRTSRPRPHDHLDDLESLFYVAFWIFHIYEGPGRFVTPFPEILTQWEDPRPANALSYKQAYFGFQGNMKRQRVTEFFGPPFQDLIENLYDFFRRNTVDTKPLPKDQKSPFEENKTAFQQAALKDYAQVLKYFDDAIEAIKEDPNFADPTLPSHPVFAGSNADASGSSPEDNDTYTRPLRMRSAKVWRRCTPFDLTTPFSWCFCQ